ncbi:MAG TPA: phage tail tube protein [Streptosporangiaceae bacterium]|nr:phage tail tube protein [Streptosporangiaceae bacterium]
MTFLSRLTKLGGAKEDVANEYLAPTFSVPFNSGSKYSDMIEALRDESIRANDSVLQGLGQGPAHAEIDLDVNGYPDLAGNWFRAIIGPDTVTPAVSTTLASDSAVNAATISLTASVPANSVLSIADSGGLNQEYVKIGAITGEGPFSAEIAQGGGAGGNTTKFAHTAAGGTVVSQTLHAFKQNRSFATVWPTYSWTTDDGADQLGWTGCVMSELGIKIDPKGWLGFTHKWTGMPSAPQSTFSYAPSTVLPQAGWGWTVTNAGASSTRGLTMDLTIKRAVEAIQSSTGIMAPREIFPGAMEIDGTYKAIFESDADLNLFKQAIQLPTIHTITQPVSLGGAVLVITMSSSGYTTGEKDLSQSYTQISQALSGIANATDAGVASVTLSNFVTSAY